MTRAVQLPGRRQSAGAVAVSGRMAQAVQLPGRIVQAVRIPVRMVYSVAMKRSEAAER